MYASGAIRPRIVSADHALIEIKRIVETAKAPRDQMSPLFVMAVAEAGLQADMRTRLTNYRPRVFCHFFGRGFDEV